MIGIVIVLTVLIVIIAVLIVHAYKKHSAWYSYLSFNVKKHVFHNFVNEFLINYFLNNFLNLFCVLM